MKRAVLFPVILVASLEDAALSALAGFAYGFGDCWVELWETWL